MVRDALHNSWLTFSVYFGIGDDALEPFSPLVAAHQSIKPWFIYRHCDRANLLIDDSVLAFRNLHLSVKHPHSFTRAPAAVVEDGVNRDL